MVNDLVYLFRVIVCTLFPLLVVVLMEGSQKCEELMQRCKHEVCLLGRGGDEGRESWEGDNFMYVYSNRVYVTLFMGV